MRQISIEEGQSKLRAVDRLVEKGLYTSREDVYKSAVELLIQADAAQRLSYSYRLDSIVYGKELRKALTSLKSNNVEDSRVALNSLSTALRTKGILSRLNDEAAGTNFEIAADGISRYAERLNQLDKFDKKTKKLILSDLQRDLTGLNLGLQEEEKSRTGQTKELESFVIFDEEHVWEGPSYTSRFEKPYRSTLKVFEGHKWETDTTSKSLLPAYQSLRQG